MREIKLKKLELERASKLKDKEASFNFAQVSFIAPTFDGSDIYGYFKVFEIVDTRHKWPQNKWMNLINPKLSGKSLRVYSSLENQDDYDLGKAQISNAMR